MGRSYPNGTTAPHNFPSQFQDKMDEDDDSTDDTKLLVAIGILGDYTDQQRVLRNLKDSIALSQNSNNVARIPPDIGQYSNRPVLPSDFPPQLGINNNQGREAAPAPAQDFKYRCLVAQYPMFNFGPWQAFMDSSLKKKARLIDGIANRLSRQSRELYHAYTAAREKRDIITLGSAIVAAMSEQQREQQREQPPAGHLPTNVAYSKWRRYIASAFSDVNLENLVKAFQDNPNIGGRDFAEKSIFLQGISGLSNGNWLYPNSWGIIVVDHLYVTYMNQHH
jgi:hypothetical protein